jgi:hypothetical protein
MFNNILPQLKNGTGESDFTKTRAYEVGFRAPTGGATTAITNWFYKGEIFEFGSGGYQAPEGAVRYNSQRELKQLMERYKEETANRTRNFLPSPTTGRDRPPNNFTDEQRPSILKRIKSVVPKEVIAVAGALTVFMLLGRK